MAPPPVEQIGESTAGDAHKTLPTPFLTKTFQLVDDRVIDDVISWNDDGSSFIVWKPTEFARDLLPKYFKHNNFSSFVRQLNTYGFRKVVPDRWEFSNDYFKKGEKRLLSDIQRRKISTPPATLAVTVAAVPAAVPVPAPITVSPTNSGDEQVISSNSSPAAVPILCRDSSFSNTAELMEENERLRKENSQLNRELTQMKSLCNNIYVLMSNYANPQQDGGSPASKPLDLLPAKPVSDVSEVTAGNRTEPDDDTCPRLFGVSIGVKRGRESEDTAAEHERLVRTLGIKSEPLDHRVVDDDEDNQETAWLKQCRRGNQRVYGVD